MSLPPPAPPSEATDIFSISDHVLADRLQFVEEIGFGNWGSVWLCRPKPSAKDGDANGASPDTVQGAKIAVKLVHRSKTTTTAARVRSLWNEMKVVRSLKNDPHPSIIPFYSFIITPSYALITMAYVPRLITVEVSESHAKEWFRSLLSGVEYLHKRGVVHNDIKPANILLSNENIPVLVDFGFAERYDVHLTEAFHSNLSYGTPEYLSPERARGLPHDTRKSDVWSLGVTFFEILIGRTPFEHSEGEQFSTKEDLEKYWARTLRGKWVGSWKMSKGIERLLRRMVLPNADLRCTASEAAADPYWTTSDAASSTHRKAASVSHSRSSSLHLDKDMARILEAMSPWSNRGNKEKDRAKADVREREKAERKERDRVSSKENMSSASSSRAVPSRGHARSQSQSQSQSHTQLRVQVLDGRGVSQTKRPAVAPVFSALSPIKHSPPASPSVVSSASLKENKTESAKPRVARKPVGPRPSLPETNSKHASVSKENAGLGREKERSAGRRSQILRDVTSARHRDENVARSTSRRAPPKTPQTSSANTSKDGNSSVRNRVMDWERERERLREMQRLEERMREAEEEREREREREEESEESEEEEEETDEEAREREREEREREAERERELQREREEAEAARRRRQIWAENDFFLPKINVGRDSSFSPPGSIPPVPLSPLFEEPSRSTEDGNESALSGLKQSLKLSIDNLTGKTMRLYKTSTQLLGRSTPALTFDGADDDESRTRMSISERASWEEEVAAEKAHAEECAEQRRLDRMSLWIRNVEKVVEDARQNFAASTSSGPSPPLPLAPVSRSSHSRGTGRSARGNRRILAANQIFVNEFDVSGQYDVDRSRCTSPSMLSSSPLPSPSFLQSMNYMEETLPTIPSEQPSRLSDAPEARDKDLPELPQTPSRKRRATVVTRSPETGRKAVSLEIDVSPSKRREKSRSHGDLLGQISPVTKLEFELQRLAAPTPTPRLSTMVDKNLFIASTPLRSSEEALATANQSKDELNASPLQVSPYPARAISPPTIDTPGRRHLETVYDRFLMSTTGVKRNGKGYQSEAPPMAATVRPHTSMAKRSSKLFLSTRRPMPPPVSSEDLRRSSSVDEFGAFNPALSTPAPASTQNNKHTIAIVRKAFKAIVTGKPNAKAGKPVWH